MGLEATLIVVDNSKYAVNGDIIPSRFAAQTDALGLLAQKKLDENQESAVGLMTMGGRNVEVVLTPVQERSMIMACINKLEIHGDSNLSRAIQIATLALKHRANKNQRQRIIVMVASPLKETQKELEAIGKKLKKNVIAIDIINLGEPGNVEKLNALVESAKNEDNSHFMNVESSMTLLTDALNTSPIVGTGAAGDAGKI